MVLPADGKGNEREPAMSFAKEAATMMMKGKMAILGLLVGLLAGSVAEAQEFQWVRQFGTTGTDQARGVWIDSSGIYVVGFVDGALPGQSSSGGTDAFLRKYDSNGNELWTRQFGTAGFDGAARVSADASGVYVVGRTDGALPGQSYAGAADAFVRKYDSDGNELWTRQFGTSSNDVANSVSLDGSGVLVGGWTGGALPGQISAGNADAFIRKYDANGNELWTLQFGTPGIDQITEGGLFADGTGVYVAGETTGALPGQINAGGGDVFVRKYNELGKEQWTRQFGGTDFDLVRGIVVDARSIYVGGFTLGALPGQSSAGSRDAFVRKYDLDGNEQWTRQFGTASLDQAHAVSAQAGGVYLFGKTDGAFPGQISAGSTDAFVRKYDVNGNEVWTRQFGSAGFDQAWGGSVGAPAVYFVGETQGTLMGQTSAGAVDAFLVALVVVTPVELLQQLAADVVALNLQQGITNSLDAKLDAVLEALDDLNENNDGAAVNALLAFINAVEAQRGIHISEADANALIAKAQQAIALLSGG